ncbi:MAG: hypothetical protein MI976_29675 [Pseudomonadales bacterium]|nr:hypothetical protein [Pseudomonadales bacterium]
MTETAKLNSQGFDEITNKLPGPAGVTYLIDASIPIFRAWFGIPDHFFDTSNRPMNAVYGYTLFLLEFLNLTQAQQVIAAFDESLETGFRHQLYPLYKANRALPDDSLAYQLETCKQVTEALGITTVASTVYEADDLIAAIARKRRLKGESVVVLSSDKDLAQMIKPGDFFWDFYGKVVSSHQDLISRWGFPVEGIADYLALVGDHVDNIPGLSGIGAKTAKVLLSHFHNLNNLYERIDEVDELPIRGVRSLKSRLLEGEADARLYLQLTTLAEGAMCPWGDKTVKLRSPNARFLSQWLESSGLKRGLSKKLDQFLNQ